MKIQNKKIFASVLFVLVSFVCSAQTVPPPPTPPPPPGLPIDGLVPAILALAGFYGVRMKIKQKK